MAKPVYPTKEECEAHKAPDEYCRRLPRFSRKKGWIPVKKAPWMH